MELENIDTELPSKIVILPLRASNDSCDKYFQRGSKLYGSVFRYLIVIFNLAYYTCAIPFRIKKSQDGHYKIHTNKIQQILTTISNVLVCYIIFRDEVSSLKRADNFIKKPEAFIDILAGLSKVPKFLILFFVFWTKKRIIQNLLNLSKNNFGKHKRKIPIIVNSIILLTIFGMLTANIFVYYNNTTASAPYVQCIENTTETGQQLNQQNNVTKEKKTFIDILQFIAAMYLVYLEELIICLNLISAIMVYHMCTTFVSILKSKDTDISQVEEHYLSIRETTKCIREFFGPFVFFYCLENLFSCLHFPFALSKVGGETFTTILICIYLAKFFITMFIAAEASLQMKCFKEWLFQFKVQELTKNCEENDRSSAVPNKNLYETLKNGCEVTKIGLGCDLFTLTYGFIGLFISVFATYGAFQLQFYNVSQNQNSEDTDTSYLPLCNFTDAANGS